MKIEIEGNTKLYAKERERERMLAFERERERERERDITHKANMSQLASLLGH